MMGLPIGSEGHLGTCSYLLCHHPVVFALLSPPAYICAVVTAVKVTPGHKHVVFGALG